MRRYAIGTRCQPLHILYVGCILILRAHMTRHPDRRVSEVNILISRAVDGSRILEVNNRGIFCHMLGRRGIVWYDL